MSGEKKHWMLGRQNNGIIPQEDNISWDAKAVRSKKGLLGKHPFSKQKFDINVVKEGLSKIYELLCWGFYWKFKTPRTEYSVLTVSHISAYKGYFVCVGVTLAQPTGKKKKKTDNNLE